MVLEQALDIASLGSLTSLVFMIISFLITGFFIWIGAYMAHVEKKSLLNSFFAALLGTIVTGIVFSFMGFTGLWAILVTILIPIFVIKLVFRTSWRKSLVTWVFSIIAQIIAVALLVFLIAGLL